MAYVKLFIVTLLSITVVTESVPTAVVQVTNGLLQGEISKTVRHQVNFSAFKGIPFAEAPVGYLRFKPPVKKGNWTGVLNATQDGNKCVQKEQESSKIVGSEDCLFLNIYTPHTNFSNFNQKDLKAVMFWIYGGGFMGGTSNSRFYGPDFLIEDDVVVVTSNYRLGPLGFLNLNHENATGNAGLKDQNLALKWVNENIAKFGGDPKKITIFGQSAGADSVDLHVLSDMSKGLFAQSISMSGSPLCLYWGMQSQAEAVAQAFTLGSKLNITAKSKDELLEGLYSASAESIILEASEIFLLPFRPTVESSTVAKNQEKFLQKCPIDKYRSGDFNKHPHMVGFTSNEVKALAESDIVKIINYNLLQTVANLTSNINNKILQQIINGGVAKLSGEVVKNFVSWLSDTIFVSGIDSKEQVMQWHNKHPIYYYRFSFESDVNWLKGNSSSSNTNPFNVRGVGHAEDLPYLFYFSESSMPLANSEIQAVVNKYTRLMTNFAKYGNPTPDGDKDSTLGITWPATGLLGLHLEINKKLSVGFRPVSPTVKLNQISGIGTSHIFTNCF